ncbi:hypothetical protein BDI4_340047 [Burkholderia diffusa]|uniref:hypothetical protein n=1 Tax=Burkholderia diffusa TaxID=488732 RepID=UPI001CACF113|nr:hypothetical protein [Burkholderia diffusa]CAG9252410.1 hypothetical protein BDI4_340047 [Burkholderia diffusa]
MIEQDTACGVPHEESNLRATRRRLASGRLVSDLWELEPGNCIYLLEDERIRRVVRHAVEIVTKLDAQRDYRISVRISIDPDRNSAEPNEYLLRIARRL